MSAICCARRNVTCIRQCSVALVGYDIAHRKKVKGDTNKKGELCRENQLQHVPSTKQMFQPYMRRPRRVRWLWATWTRSCGMLECRHQLGSRSNFRWIHTLTPGLHAVNYIVFVCTQFPYSFGENVMHTAISYPKVAQKTPTLRCSLVPDLNWRNRVLLTIQ